MKKIYSTLLFVFAVFIAFSQQPVNGNKEYTGTATFDTTAIFKSQVRLKSGTDSLVEQFTSGRFVFSYGNQFLSFGSAATNIGNTSNYTIGAGSNFDLHKAGADTVLGTFSGDTLYFDGQHNLAAYVFNPPLNTSSVTGFWKTTGNAGTTPGTNYIGTTDAKSVVFKTNNTDAWSIDTLGNLLPASNNAEKIGSPSLAINRIYAGKIISDLFKFKDTDDNTILTIDNATDLITFDVDTPKFNVPLLITDGTQGAGKVLTSDATGLASWAASSTTPLDSATIYALTPTLGTQYYCTDCTGNGITGRIVAYIAAAWRRLLFED